MQIIINIKGFNLFMGEVPAELFELGDKKREYWYINPKGEEDFVILGADDILTKKRCLLDGVYMISYRGDLHNVLECPACHKLGFDMNVNTAKEISDKVIPYLKCRTERLKEEINHLEALLKLAENPDNTIRQLNLENSLYNKANLSTKFPEPIIVDKSKAGKRYPIRESQFTKGSRLNH